MDSGGSPYRGPIADLVNPYAGPHNDECKSSIVEIKAWMNNHPGRWCMFSEGELGVSRSNFEDPRYEVRLKKDPKTRLVCGYARLKHRQGESLEAALAHAGNLGRYPADLPDLDRDSFNWTPEELAEAVRASKEMLFPKRIRRTLKVAA